MTHVHELTHNILYKVVITNICTSQVTSAEMGDFDTVNLRGQPNAPNPRVRGFPSIIVGYRCDESTCRPR